MLEARISSYYQRYCLSAVVRYLARHRWLRPLHITLFSVCVGLLVPISLCMGWVALAVVCCLVSGYADTLDGAFARETGLVSDLGAVLDITADRIVEIALCIGLFWMEPGTRGGAVIGMLASILFCVTTFLVVGIFANAKGAKSFYYSPGLMERAEAFIFFIAMMVFPNFFTILSTTFSVLVVWTGLYRIWEFSVYVSNDS